MRILHCIRSLEVGGSERQLVTLSSLLVAYGWDVHIAVLHSGEFEALLDPATTLHRIHSRRNSDPLILARLVRLVRQTQPAIVQTWLPQMDIFAGVAALLCGTPWILSERSSALAHTKSWQSSLRQRLGAFANGIVANSCGGTDFWREHNRRHSLHRVIPNAIAAPPVVAEDPVLDLVAPGSSPVVVYVGRLSPEKRIPQFIEALVAARRELPITALICGEGAMAQELRARAETLGIVEAVRFTGFVRNVSAVLERADLFVSLSRFEGSPNAVQEAVIAGIPVLLSDIPAHRELLDETSAMFVDGDDPEAIAAAILDSLRDREAMRKRAEAAHRRADQWSPAAVTEAYDAFYRQVLGWPCGF